MGNSDSSRGWSTTDTVAWTKHDGAAPAPRHAGPWVMGSLTLSLSAVWVGIIATDALCPEHRLWVQTLGVTALVAAVIACCGLIGQRAWAWIATLVSASMGMAVGVIDTVHNQTRGAMLAVGFAVVAVIVGVVGVFQLRAATWKRGVEVQLAPEPLEPFDHPLALPMQVNDALAEVTETAQTADEVGHTAPV